ncbi:GNAT family N-acetyltransferase [Streptomyces hirsutus]|uniref:GNAT family N-acetyltransferase n=1 Tax=Streptomyces hirsutus TaxID=35620 RepID=UPI0034441AA8
MTATHRTADSPVIRTALAADIAVLHLRTRSAYCPDGVPEDGTDGPAVWREAVARPEGRVPYAVRDGHLAGLASFRTPPEAPADTVKLFQFHVDPDHWRTGIGTALHAACVEEWRANGLRTPPYSTCTSTTAASRPSTPAWAGPPTRPVRPRRPPPVPALRGARGMNRTG